MKFFKILIWASVLITFYVSDCNCKSRPQDEDDLQDEISDDYLQQLEINSHVITGLKNNRRERSGHNDEGKDAKNIEAHHAPAVLENDFGRAIKMEGGHPVRSRSNGHDLRSPASDAKFGDVKESVYSQDAAPALSENDFGKVIKMEGGRPVRKSESERHDLRSPASEAKSGEAPAETKSIRHQDPSPSLSENELGRVIKMDGNRPVRSKGNRHDLTSSAPGAKVTEATKRIRHQNLAPAQSENEVAGSAIKLEKGRPVPVNIPELRSPASDDAHHHHHDPAPTLAEGEVGSVVNPWNGRPVQVNVQDVRSPASDSKGGEAPGEQKSELHHHDDTAPALSENEVGSVMNLEKVQPAPASLHDLRSPASEVEDAPKDKESVVRHDSAPASALRRNRTVTNKEKVAPSQKSFRDTKSSGKEDKLGAPSKANNISRRPNNSAPAASEDNRKYGRVMKNEEASSAHDKHPGMQSPGHQDNHDDSPSGNNSLRHEDSAPAAIPEKGPSFPSSAVLDLKSPSSEANEVEAPRAKKSVGHHDSAPAAQSEHDIGSVINLEKGRPVLVNGNDVGAPASDVKPDEAQTDKKSLPQQDSAPAILKNVIAPAANLEKDKPVRVNLQNHLESAAASHVEVDQAEEDEDEDEEDEDNPNSPPENLPDTIKKEEPLAHVDSKDDSYVPPPAKASVISTKVDHQEPTPAEKQTGSKPHPFALFTIANTNTGISYAQLPYREKYQWHDKAAPCHSFHLKIPDELAEKAMIKLCIFRPSLEFPDESNQFLLNENGKDKIAPQNVMGFVIQSPGSSVYGRIEDGMFYGEVSLIDQERNLPTIFVIEDINLLNRLMRYNPKTLRHMLMVMQGPDKKKGHTKDKHEYLVYNAVVTKGASLINFMLYTSTMDVNRNPFLMFSTSHNSYIISGEPLMKVDESGEVRLESGKNKIQVGNDGSIRINIPDKEYIFRPNGRTIIKEGMEVRTLQEHEGSVAITAYSSSSTYDCVLPTPAFQAIRKGGYVCKVCIAVDATFKKYFGGSMVPKEEDADLGKNYLGRIIDRVSWIFRSMDLNGDKQPDNIGLDYEDHAVHWAYPDIGGEDVGEQDIEVLFQSLEGYSFGDCCLGIGFTMKNFPKDVLGKRTQAKSGPSGVCAGKTGRVANNLIIMSANSKQGNYSSITEDQLIYATANQIAGAFGASPDGTGNDLCDQFVEGQVTRHHLMWPEVMRNTSLSEQSLSTCSKSDVLKVLSTCRSSCFDIDQHPFCGNGIVEEGEECDCGSELNCDTQTCCYSRIGQYPCRKTGVGCTQSGALSLHSTGVISSTAILLLGFGRHLLSP